MHSTLPTQHSRLRLLAEWCLWFVIAVVIFRTWFVEGLAIPDKVAGGSMATTLLGPHREVVCGDCGFRFNIGIASAEPRERAVCPNCGYFDIPLADVPDLDGDGLLVHKSVFRLRNPRRWEVAALRRPGEADQLLVKRIVGLPGERVQIVGGDVLVDDQVQRKNLREQRALRVLVHDANYPARKEPLPPRRWRGENEQSEWGSVGGRFARPSTPDDKAIDWLVYHHAYRLPTAEGAEKPWKLVDGPITDRLAYNQSRPRRDEDIQRMTDLMLSLRLRETRGEGLLILRATDGRNEFQVRLDPVRGRYEVLRNGRPVPAALGSIPASNGKLAIEFSLFDHQLLLAFDGKTRVRWPYDPSPAEPKPTAQPVAIGAKRLGVSLDDVKIFRDVYYTNPLGPHNAEGVDEPLELGPGEYYVLGDNAAISQDSRTWAEGPVLPANLLVGKPLCVHFPARRVKWGNWVFQVPDPARMRYVR